MYICVLLTTAKFSRNTGQTEKYLILFFGASAPTRIQFCEFQNFILACNCRNYSPIFIFLPKGLEVITRHHTTLAVMLWFSEFSDQHWSQPILNRQYIFSAYSTAAFWPFFHIILAVLFVDISINTNKFLGPLCYQLLTSLLKPFKKGFNFASHTTQVICGNWFYLRVPGPKDRFEKIFMVMLITIRNKLLPVDWREKVANRNIFTNLLFCSKRLDWDLNHQLFTM